MTRKRFVKLLMSKGYSRNVAMDKAFIVHLMRKSYSQSYKEMSLKISLNVVFENMAKAIVRVGEAFQKLSEAFKNIPFIPQNLIDEGVISNEYPYLEFNPVCEVDQE